MVQLLITGHAHFGSGLLSSIKLITGLQNELTAIDFTESMSATDLNTELKKCIENDTEDVLILTDIPGGTPFNQSVLLKTEMKNRSIEVIAGTNLPLLIEAVMNKNQESKKLIEHLVTVGSQSISVYEAKRRNTPSENLDEGI
ncbi:PTS sugar transporter subunit IIA [Lacticigenium naphthae]|uniref:PTS sugar transporter subunit IIA n=1 Tax=Lacticigenium naphthae TaxID=515351 RepID=UPI00040799A8|nr:PTS sugar transporter subunit IIA [Lacticigenium naphthae]